MFNVKVDIYNSVIRLLTAKDAGKCSLCNQKEKKTDLGDY